MGPVVRDEGYPRTVCRFARASSVEDSWRLPPCVFPTLATLCSVSKRALVSSPAQWLSCTLLISPPPLSLSNGNPLKRAAVSPLIMWCTIRKYTTSPCTRLYSS
uniref:Uncharacterized protein n=1 Tax=Cacopsylla melanoneura TaxID=428564 RepID=A0A8D8TB94_9HEMI